MEQYPGDAMGAGTAAVGGVFMMVWLAVMVILIVSLWKVFTKAGQAGWLSLIPFVNIYILLKIVGKPGWWLLLMLVPFVNLVIGIIVMVELAKCFGQSTPFALGLVFLPFVFYPILAFGSSTYRAPIGVI